MNLRDECRGVIERHHPYQKRNDASLHVDQIGDGWSGFLWPGRIWCHAVILVRGLWLVSAVSIASVTNRLNDLSCSAQWTFARRSNERSMEIVFDWNLPPMVWSDFVVIFILEILLSQNHISCNYYFHNFTNIFQPCSNGCIHPPFVIVRNGAAGYGFIDAGNKRR